jgi:hypothetical protein
MKSSKGFPLEFDGYCSDLRVAFEHQGPHHYSEEKLFHRDDLISRSQRIENDKRKKEYAVLNNIELIIVPWIPVKLELPRVVEFLREKTQEYPTLESALLMSLESFVVDWKKLTNHRNTQLTKRVRSQVELKGGTLISDIVLHATSKIEVSCQHEHRFITCWNKIDQGRWCPVCGGSRRKSLVDCQNVASDHGGSCLSQVYVNAKTKLQWRCAYGHEWDASYNHIKTGTWCPVCAGNRRRPIQMFVDLARKKGGQLLSREYINSRTPLSWRCGEGHEWKASADNVLNKSSWCPVCAAKKK